MAASVIEFFGEGKKMPSQKQKAYFLGNKILSSLIIT
jgi:hypothetical protein